MLCLLLSGKTHVNKICFLHGFSWSVCFLQVIFNFPTYQSRPYPLLPSCNLNKAKRIENSSKSVRKLTNRMTLKAVKLIYRHRLVFQTLNDFY